MLHLTKGKIFDKQKLFEQAVQQYTSALRSSEHLKLNVQTLGNIKFRLGWSHVRARKEVDQGVKYLEEAAVLLPDNSEVLLKMAGALFMDVPESFEVN